MTHKISLLHSNGGDWVGMYINGKLVYEGHDIQPVRVLSLLVEHNVLSADLQDKWDDSENLETWGGRCPAEWPDE